MNYSYLYYMFLCFVVHSVVSMHQPKSPPPLRDILIRDLSRKAFTDEELARVLPQELHKAIIFARGQTTELVGPALSGALVEPIRVPSFKAPTPPAVKNAVFKECVNARNIGSHIRFAIFRHRSVEYLHDILLFSRDHYIPVSLDKHLFDLAAQRSGDEIDARLTQELLYFGANPHIKYRVITGGGYMYGNNYVESDCSSEDVAKGKVKEVLIAQCKNT